MLATNRPCVFMCEVSTSDMKVSDPRLLGPGFAVNGKGDISLKNLLLHNAGYPPDPSPNYC